MPRSRTRGGSQPRRTNWLSRVSAAHTTVASGATGTHHILDVSNAANEESQYVDSTLIRIRGVICIDGNFSITPPDDENYLVGALLWVNQDGVAPANNDEGYALDEILWQDMVGESSDWRINTDTAVAVNRYGYRVAHQKMVVDVKAMRRLGDRSRLGLSIHNFSGVTNPVQIAFNYALRVLIKE